MLKFKLDRRKPQPILHGIQNLGKRRLLRHGPLFRHRHHISLHLIVNNGPGRANFWVEDAMMSLMRIEPWWVGIVRIVILQLFMTVLLFVEGGDALSTLLFDL